MVDQQLGAATSRSIKKHGKEDQLGKYAVKMHYVSNKTLLRCQNIKFQSKTQGLARFNLNWAELRECYIDRQY